MNLQTLVVEALVKRNMTVEQTVEALKDRYDEHLIRAMYIEEAQELMEF